MSEQICNIKKTGGSSGSYEYERVTLGTLNATNFYGSGTFQLGVDCSGTAGYQDFTADNIVAACSYIIQNSIYNIGVKSYDSSTGYCVVTFEKPYSGTAYITVYGIKVKS